MVDDGFARKLRIALAWRGYTPADMARHMGISPQAVSKYLAGKMLPNSARLLQMVRFLNISMDFLVSGDDVSGQVEDVLASKPVRASERMIHGGKRLARS